MSTAMLLPTMIILLLLAPVNAMQGDDDDDAAAAGSRMDMSYTSDQRWTGGHVVVVNKLFFDL